MTENEFQQLIARSEGETLDFKEAGYDLKNSRNKFIKDVLAMANTPREHTAHIVFGVRWTPESGSTVVGLEHQLDDVELQHALGENLVQPIPRFTYTPLRFEGKQVGVLEIPVGRDGPYVPITDQGKKRQNSSAYDEQLQAGTVYWRRGSQNVRATSSELKQIVAWFQGGDSSILDEQGTDSWRRFLDAVYRFEQGTTYLLVVDRISPETAVPLHALGRPPWRAVIDFDPDSEASGFLSCIAGTLGSHRVIHRVVRGQYDVQPEPGTHWFFARGLSGRQDTVSEGDHKTWLKAYKREISRQLDRVAATVSPSPVVAVILWSEVSLRNHLRTLIEELHGTFGEALEIVFVASDEASFAGIAEDGGATFVQMNLRSLCNGVAVYYADLYGGEDERYILPSSSGAPVEVETDDWLWLSEDLDLVHKSIGLAGDDDAKEYRRGADITWRNLHLQHDCDRDITPMVRSQVEADLRRRQTVRINIYHAPGSGGTTVGRRIAWDLRNTFPVGILRRCTPSDTAERIAKVAALTESSVVVVVDGGQHSEREIDDLYELLKANQTPVVLLQVLRRFQSQTSEGRRQFWLDTPLTNTEADRFRDAYTKAVPVRETALTRLAAQRARERYEAEQRSAFFFGLTAFEKEFRGLRPYVENRIAGLTDKQHRILVYIAIAHYYGQQSVPAQAFASLLGLPPSRRLDLKAAFSNEAVRALELLIVNAQAEWRTAHHLIAHEIMQQILAPKGSQEPEAVWRQYLSSWGENFATFCQGDEGPTSDRLLELVRRVFIYRDNVEVLGTERAAQKQFAQLIDDIPLSQGRIKVLEHLTDCFPLEAHFHAHLGRLLSLSGEHDRALDCLDFALSLQQDDHVLHHMRGMMLRQSMRAKAEEEAPIDRLTEIARRASESFEKARQLQPDQEHGYISEVQMLISLVDESRRDRREDVMRDVLAQPNTDPFLKGALEKAEDLLDRVHHLYVGEQPSRYALDCRARLQRFYGDYQTALQSWDNLLARPEVAKPPVRRQIVWTILRRGEGDWNKITKKETERIRRLLEENLEEEINDSTSLRLWLRAIRQSQTPPSLDAVIERVSYWKANTGALDAAYYLYVLHMLRALEGSSQGAADAEQALEECRSLTRFRRDRTRSFEWIGPGDGISILVHQSRLGDWAEDFWESAGALARLDGRISSIDGPQKGSVELSGGVKAFLVPAKSGFQAGRDENAPVNCYLGFSYEGPRAWDVQPA